MRIKLSSLAMGAMLISIVYATFMIYSVDAKLEILEERISGCLQDLKN